MKDDTAEMTGTVDDCLYSIGNRVATAKILSAMGETKLLDTILEDVAYFCQMMMDEHCIIKEGK